MRGSSAHSAPPASAALVPVVAPVPSALAAQPFEATIPPGANFDRADFRLPFADAPRTTYPPRGSRPGR